MTSVVADTHTLIWYLFDLERLSATAFTTLEQTVNSGNPIYISAITLVEIVYLVEKKRFSEEVLTRLVNALDDPNTGISLVPLDQNISGAIRQIDRETVPDMPDRIIAATAFYLGISLVTRDLRIQALTNIETIW
ncbi:MAG: type II toxin-antitoxin system VapC family toxin [Calothrix sp. MO_192.B10]|nr:type II toxin-antitoxin system VapC family toxin [Calothrix sp. MO_192.B10]